MPCPLCYSLFPHIPCNENETTKEFMDALNKRYILKSPQKESIMVRYNRLKTNCPCVNCMVKMICNNKRFDCDTWKDFIVQYESGVYNSAS